MQHHEIRRHPDGMIDLDFYRAKAVTLRTQTIRRIFRKMSLRTTAVIAAAALAVAAFALAPALGRDGAVGAICKRLEAVAGIS